MGQWYEVSVYRAHRGAGRKETTRGYIFAEDIMGVMKRYRHMPGVKRSIGRNSPFPNINPISPQESSALEKRIQDEKIISLSRAKKTWYYERRD